MIRDQEAGGSLRLRSGLANPLASATSSTTYWVAHRLSSLAAFGISPAGSDDQKTAQVQIHLSRFSKFSSEMSRRDAARKRNSGEVISSGHGKARIRCWRRRGPERVRDPAFPLWLRCFLRKSGPLSQSQRRFSSEKPWEVRHQQKSRRSRLECAARRH